MKHIPNIITALRIMLTPLLVVAILDGHYETALYYAVLMGLSDGMDGFLAKRFGWCSQLGEQLDPLADKLMLVSAFIALWWTDLLPSWFVAVVVFRDISLVAGASIRRFKQGLPPLRPIFLGKVSTFMQIILAFSVLLEQMFPEVRMLTQGLTLIAAVTAVGSAIKYSQDFFSMWRVRQIKGHYRSQLVHNSTKPEILK